MTASLGPRLAVIGTAGHWQAAVRLGHRRSLATCGHTHRNRDGGQANARQCGQLLVRAARNPQLAAGFINDAQAAAGFARYAGARITNAEARERAQTTLDAWRSVVLEHDLHVPALTWGTPRPACGCCPTPATPEDQERLARVSAHRAPWSAR